MGVIASDKGLEYFSVYISEFDSDSVVLLEEALGEEAFTRYLKLRAAILENSYFIKWDEISSRLYCKRRNYALNEINNLIKKCCSVGLFSSDMYEWYGILTSSIIQINYITVVYRRGFPKILHEYMVLSKEELEDHKVKIKAMNIFNLKEEKLDNGKLLPIITRPKKKVYILNDNNLFTPTEEKEISTERQKEFDDAIKDVIGRPATLNGFHIEDKPVEQIPTPDYSYKPFTFSEAIKEAKIPYEEKLDGYKKVYTKRQHLMYLNFLEDIYALYQEILISKRQVYISELFDILQSLQPEDAHIEKALTQICKLGHVKENSNMAFMLKGQIILAIGDDQKKKTQEKFNKNPNHVDRKN